MILGIDPGSLSGGAVLQDEGTVLAWWVWLKNKRGILRLRASVGDEVVLPHMHAIGVAIAAAIPSYPSLKRLVVERSYVGRMRKKGRRVNPQSVIPLAESAGLVMGPLLDHGAVLVRPLASEWRKQILGLTNQDADACEEYAVMMVPHLLTWPEGFPAGLTYEEEGAVAEAGCMTLWRP